MLAVQLSAVDKRYGDGAAAVHGLRGVTLEIEAGAFVAVVGQSGSGKSTLLNVIGGIDVATAGRARVLGHDLEALDDGARSDLRLRSVGFVFQTFNLFPTFTATDNVAWPRRFAGDTWRQARRLAAAALRAVGLDGRAGARLPAELSGGEQQRVAIARALINEPSLLLADEPTGNLDSTTATAILDLIAQAQRDRELTVILVTHNPAAAAYGSRVVELRDGTVVRDHRPAAALAAGGRA